MQETASIQGITKSYEIIGDIVQIEQFQPCIPRLLCVGFSGIGLKS